MYLTHDGPVLERPDFPAYPARRYARLNEPSGVYGLPRWAVCRDTGLMPLDPAMLNSVVRVTSLGSFVGSGFVVGVPSKAFANKRWDYVVTADHVVRNEIETAVEIPDIRQKGRLSEPIPIPSWRYPLEPADIAVAPLPSVPGAQWQRVRLDLDVVAPGEVLGLAQPIQYLGIFSPGGSLETPMARAGTIGALDRQFDHWDKDRCRQYSYLSHFIDCRSYDGFSGSPCFALTESAVANEVVPAPFQTPLKPDGTPKELHPIGHFALLAGMFTAHFSDEGEETNPSDLVSRYGVGVMLTVRYIWEALMTDDAQKERREWDEQLSAEAEAGQPPVRAAGAGRAPAGNPEFDRFQALTQKLVNTPKLDR